MQSIELLVDDEDWPWSSTGSCYFKIVLYQINANILRSSIGDRVLSILSVTYFSELT